jgi:hypothetical protein
VISLVLATALSCQVIEATKVPVAPGGLRCEVLTLEASARLQRLLAEGRAQVISRPTAVGEPAKVYVAAAQGLKVIARPAGPGHFWLELTPPWQLPAKLIAVGHRDPDIDPRAIKTTVRVEAGQTLAVRTRGKDADIILLVTPTEATAQP